jgi:hypothetical protein
MYLFVKSIDYRSGYTKPGKWAVMYLFVKSRSGYTNPGKWAVMYLFAKSIDYRSETSKSQKEIQSMDLTNKYMTAHFPGLV